MRGITAALTLVTTSALQAASLTSVGVLEQSDGHRFSEVRGVSADGTYVVGGSTAWTLTSAANQTYDWRETPFIWSAASGIVQLPNPSGNNSRAHGVSVGIGSNTGNIIISGLHEGLLASRYYKAPLTTLGSGAWADAGAAGSLGHANLRGGTSNVLRNQVAGDGRWYLAGRKGNDNRAARLRGDPFIGWDTIVMTAESVSGHGVIVGRNSGFSPSRASWRSPQGDDGEVPGDTAIRADGFGISSNFGKSTTSDFDVQWICGQSQSATGTNMQAFRWKRGDASMQLLGMLPDATSSVAYTIADNGVAAGRSYFGNAAPTYEVATVWAGLGMAQSLQDLLDASGVDTSEWTRLTQVYAVSDDGTTLAGNGVWAADGTTRGFVAHLDDFPAVGACCVDGFGSRSCGMTTEANCSGTFTANQACANACLPCAVPFADADFDGDVDMSDFGAFQACFTGADVGVAGGCGCFDRPLGGAKDNLIDQGDLAAFSKCVTGPEIPFNPASPPADCEPGTGQLP